MFPQDAIQLLILVAAVVPGFVYQISRRRIRGPGPDEQSTTIRVLRSIATSVVFLCAYIVAFGYPPLGVTLGADGLPTSWRGVAFWILTLALAVPWTAARIGYYIVTSSLFIQASSAIVDKLKLRRQWDPTPSAWDFAFADRGEGWVRVQSSDGAWMGGWYGNASFASSYPDPREIFLEVGYAMNSDGEFTGEVSAPDGIYIRCDDVRLLDFSAHEDQDVSPAQPADILNAAGENRSENG